MRRILRHIKRLPTIGIKLHCIKNQQKIINKKKGRESIQALQRQWRRTHRELGFSSGTFRNRSLP
jgi:hypothetical protein